MDVLDFEFLFLSTRSSLGSALWHWAFCRLSNGLGGLGSRLKTSGLFVGFVCLLLLLGGADGVIPLFLTDLWLLLFFWRAVRCKTNQLRPLPFCRYVGPFASPKL